MLTAAGLDDKTVTSSDHPCKKFADAFMSNLDLIAERKSVVFHLRELARASVMPKFLEEAEAKIQKSWYKLADEIVSIHMSSWLHKESAHDKFLLPSSRLRRGHVLSCNLSGLLVPTRAPPQG